MLKLRPAVAELVPAANQTFLIQMWLLECVLGTGKGLGVIFRLIVVKVEDLYTEKYNFIRNKKTGNGLS